MYKFGRPRSFSFFICDYKNSAPTLLIQQLCSTSSLALTVLPVTSRSRSEERFLERVSN
jgi:hypothetical protein